MQFPSSFLALASLLTFTALVSTRLRRRIYGSLTSSSARIGWRRGRLYGYHNPPRLGEGVSLHRQQDVRRYLDVSKATLIALRRELTTSQPRPQYHGQCESHTYSNHQCCLRTCAHPCRPGDVLQSLRHSSGPETDIYTCINMRMR